MANLQADVRNGTERNSADNVSMAVDIAALRTDFVAVRVFFLECGEWNAEQAAAIASDIGDCAKQDDMGMLAFWCEWFAHWGRIARAHAAQMVAIELAAADWWREQGRRAA
jgi:hypothetical protein